MCLVCNKYKIATLTNAWRAVPASLSAYTLSFALRCKCSRGRVIWDVDDLPVSVAVSSSTMTNDDAAVVVLPLLAALPPPLLDRRVRILLYCIIDIILLLWHRHHFPLASVYHVPRSRCTMHHHCCVWKNAQRSKMPMCSLPLSVLRVLRKYLSVHREIFLYQHIYGKRYNILSLKQFNGITN